MDRTTVHRQPITVVEEEIRLAAVRADSVNRAIHMFFELVRVGSILHIGVRVANKLELQERVYALDELQFEQEQSKVREQFRGVWEG
jgi:hypothetical protein